MLHKYGVTHSTLRGATVSAVPVNARFCPFQSTLPCGERLISWLHFWLHNKNFNPRSPAGSDFICSRRLLFCRLFQSTLPCGERLVLDPAVKLLLKFQSTLPCGERRRCPCIVPLGISISIHAPLRGATLSAPGVCSSAGYFNPRSPAGSDLLSF